MSFVGRRVRANNEKQPSRNRSEGRMKNYESSTDSRAWSSIGQERAQHLVEYLGGDNDQQSVHNLPKYCLTNALVPSKNDPYNYLKKKTEYMEKLIQIYSQLDLTSEQAQQIAKLMDSLQESHTALIKDLKDYASQTEEDQKEMLKIFEAEWLHAKAQLDNSLSTSSSLVSAEIPLSLDLFKELVENIIKKPTISGVVTLPKTTTQHSIPAGYFAGGEHSLSMLRASQELGMQNRPVAIQSDTCLTVSEQNLILNMPFKYVVRKHLVSKPNKPTVVKQPPVTKSVKDSAVQPSRTSIPADRSSKKHIAMQIEPFELTSTCDSTQQTVEENEESNPPLTEVFIRSESKPFDTKTADFEVQVSPVESAINQNYDKGVNTSNFFIVEKKPCVTDLTNMDHQLSVAKTVDTTTSYDIKEESNNDKGDNTDNIESVQNTAIFKPVETEIVQPALEELEVNQQKTLTHSEVQSSNVLDATSASQTERQTFQLTQTDDRETRHECSQTEESESARGNEESAYKIPAASRSLSCHCFGTNRSLILLTPSANYIRYIPNKNQEDQLFLFSHKANSNNEFFERKLLQGIKVNRICRKTEESPDSSNVEGDIESIVFENDDDSDTLVTHKNVELIAFKNALVATESYSKEQKKHATIALEKLENIKIVATECDDLRRKLEQSQKELKDLKEQSKSSAKKTSEAIEPDLEALSPGGLTQKAMANIVTREMYVKKKISDQLAAAHKENWQLKERLSNLEDAFSKLGISDCSQAGIDELNKQMQTLKETTKERDNLKSKLDTLEVELKSYAYILEDVDVLKQRSLLLDDVLRDRDRLSKRVEELRDLNQEIITLRKKALRIDQLEDDLRKVVRDKRIAEEEIERLRGKCSLAEIESFTHKAEGEELRSKVNCMEHEIETLKCVSMERQRLLEERNHLKKSLDDLARMQDEYEHMKKQMKCLEMLKAERDMFKSKYENLIGLECECDILRTQIEKAKLIEKERETLEAQVDDLHACITEQEAEIRRLVCHVDNLARGRDEQQEKLQEVIMSMRLQLEQKDVLIASAEEKLAMAQKELGNSINGLSSETINLKLYNENLTKLADKNEAEINELKRIVYLLRSDNENLNQQLTEVMRDNDFLTTNLNEKENSLNTLKDVLHDHEYILDEFQKLQVQCKENLRDIETETDEFNLVALRQPSISIQERLIRVSKIAGDTHFQELLLQSKQAIQKIANELDKQYNEWDAFKTKQTAGGKPLAKKPSPSNKDMYVGFCFTEGGAANKTVKRRCIRAIRKRKILKKSSNAELRETKKHQSQTQSKETLIGDLDICTQTDFEIPCLVSQMIQTSDDASTFTEQDVFELCLSGSPATSPRDEDVYESARSTDCARCKYLNEQVVIIETELLKTNDVVLELQRKLSDAKEENASLNNQLSDAENNNNQRVTELLEYIKKSDGKCTELQEQIIELKQNNCNLLIKGELLANEINDLRHQNDKLKKVLSNNIIKQTQRCTELEGKLDSLMKMNGELKEENDRLKSLEIVNDKLAARIDENRKLQEELRRLKKDGVDPILLTTLQEKNAILTQTIESQADEIAKLMDVLNVRSSPKEEPLEYQEEQNSLRFLSEDIENQLKQLDSLTSINTSNENVQNTINILARRLEKEEIRADTSENSLRHLKATDPSAMLNAEIAKLNLKIHLIEDENSKLNEINQHKTIEIEKMSDDIMKLQSENEAFKNDNKDMENKVNELRKIKDDTSILLEEFDSVKNENQQLSRDLTKLKETFDSSANYSELESELSKYKAKCVELEATNIKLKKELENAIASIQDTEDRLIQNDGVVNNDQYTTNTGEGDNNLQNLLEKLKIKNYELSKELIASQEKIHEFNIVIVEHKNQITSLESKIYILETENGKLGKDLKVIFDKASEFESFNASLNQQLRLLQETNESLKSAVSPLELERDKSAVTINELLKKTEILEEKNDEYKRNVEAVNQLKQELSALQKTLNQLEAENVKLKSKCDAKMEYSSDYKMVSTTGHQCKKLTNDLETAQAKDLSNQDLDFKEQIEMLENEKDELRKDFEKTLQYAEKRNNRVEKLKEENGKMKQTIKQLECEINRLKSEHRVSLEDAISTLQSAPDAKPQEISDLEGIVRKLKQDCEAAYGELKSSEEITTKLRVDNANQKKQISELEYEISKLTNVAREMKKVQNNQEGHFKIIIELQKDNSALTNTLNDEKNENKLLKDKIHLLQNEIDRLNNDITALIEDKISLEDDLQRFKDSDCNLKILMQEMESLKQRTRQTHESELILENNSKLNKKLEDMENENNNLKVTLQQYIEDINNTTTENKKLKQEIATLKARIEDLEKIDIQKSADGNKIAESSEKLQAELQEVLKDRERLKNVLMEQKRRSKDIKLKVDQVESLIKNERMKCKEEQMRNKELENTINELNEKQKLLIEQLESNNKEKTEDEISIATISEKEMQFFGKPLSGAKPAFNLISKKLAREGLNKLNIDELQVLNNTLAEVTADRLVSIAQEFGVLKPDENNKLSLLKKVANLEGELAEKQEESQQSIVAMQHAIKLEKHRILELQNKLEEERKENKKLLSKVCPQSQLVRNNSSDQSNVSMRSLNERDFKRVQNEQKLKLSSNDSRSKVKSTKPLMTVKARTKNSDVEFQKYRCHSPSSTPVKDTSGPSLSTKGSNYY
ncbi:unnamed protein product [Phyllotreta striolata]|uniref:Uncharacterized protein n=1 Tax=Phyllotreta striolata TaxID=444603 RepID=A0A9P0GYK5_PHYSR|nr:unnamed protein product [Phyllotreta striolata]